MRILSPEHNEEVEGKSHPEFFSDHHLGGKSAAGETD